MVTVKISAWKLFSESMSVAIEDVHFILGPRTTHLSTNEVSFLLLILLPLRLFVCFPLECRITNGTLTGTTTRMTRMLILPSVMHVTARNRLRKNNYIRLRSVRLKKKRSRRRTRDRRRVKSEWMIWNRSRIRRLNQSLSSLSASPSSRLSSRESSWM